MSDKALRLYGLRAENFMKLQVVEKTFDGSSTIRITGRNAQGKTSFIEALASALGGEKLTPKTPIRIGAKDAEVTVDLGEYIVTRRWAETDKGVTSSLFVKSPEGMKLKSPQTLLDGLIGKLSFDPLAFARSKQAEQVETLKALVGLDFTLLDLQRKTHFDNRTVVNRDVAGLRGQLDAMKLVVAPDEPVSVGDLLKEQQAAIEEQRRYDALKRASEEAGQACLRAGARVSAAKAALLRAQAELKEAEDAEIKAREHEEEASGEYAVATRPGLDAIRERLAKAEETNELVRQKKARAAAHDKLRAREREAADLTAKIVAIDNNKRDALASAKFPVPGLSFTPSDLPDGRVDYAVTFKDVPFVQVNHADQIQVSMAIGLAANAKLKLVLIRDGSALDDDMMMMVAAMADAAGAQVLIERVWRDGETGILIEDGLIVDNEKAA